MSQMLNLKGLVLIFFFLSFGFGTQAEEEVLIFRNSDASSRHLFLDGSEEAIN
jgi:hypothetical protein